MLALCQKRRRREEEEDADRRPRYWDWRAVDPNDYNPVYPFLPPPTGGDDVIIPFPMPPFASDWDFYLSNRSILNIRTSAPIIHTRNGLTLSLGDGLELQDGKLVAVGGGGGGIVYTGVAPIAINNRQISLSINTNTLSVENGQLTARRYTAAPPLALAGDLIYMNLDAGLGLNTSSALIVKVGDGLTYNTNGVVVLNLNEEGGLETNASGQLQLLLSAPLTSSRVGLGLNLGPAMLVNDGGELTLAVKNPLNTTGGQLGLALGNGLQINAAGELEATAKPVAVGTPLRLDANGTIQLPLGQGLRGNSQVALSVDVASPLGFGSGGTGPVRLDYDQSTLQLNANNALTVNLTAPLTSDAESQGISLNYEAPLNLVDDKLTVTVEDPLAVNDTGNALVLRLGAGLQLDNAGALTVTSSGGGETELSATPPLTLADDVLGLTVGSGLQITDGALALRLQPSPPLFLNQSTTTPPGPPALTFNYGGGLIITSGGQLIINPVEPLFTSWTSVPGGPSELGLHIDQNTITTNSGLGVRLAAPMITQGQGITIDYDSPLSLTDDKLAITVEDPLNIGTNGLQLRLGAGLKIDDSGALTLDTAAPLKTTTDNKVTVAYDSRLGLNLYDDALNVAVIEPMTFVGGLLTINRGNGLGVGNDSKLTVTASNPLTVDSSGVGLSYNTNTLGLDDTGKLTVKAVPVNLTAANPLQYNSTTGNLTLKLNPGQMNAPNYLSLLNPVYVYQTLPNTPIRLRNSTYNEYGNAHVKMTRLGYNILFDFHILGETTSTGTQTWTLEFNVNNGVCLTGTMRVVTGQGSTDNTTDTLFIIPEDAWLSSNFSKGFLPIVCSENGAFKQSTYCSWRVYKSTNIFIELKSTTSSAKPIFSLQFMYPCKYGMF